MPVVIDASALVELLLQSERAPAVLQAVGATDMVAPDAINPEVLSTLRRFERIGEAADRQGRAGRRRPARGRCAPLPTLPQLPESWTLRADLTPFDACYVALARNLGCPLVTGDRRRSLAPGLGVPLITV